MRPVEVKWRDSGDVLQEFPWIQGAISPRETPKMIGRCEVGPYTAYRLMTRTGFSCCTARASDGTVIASINDENEIAGKSVLDLSDKDLERVSYILVEQDASKWSWLTDDTVELWSVREYHLSSWAKDRKESFLCVKDGARELDRLVPGWWRVIDVHSLDRLEERYVVPIRHPHHEKGCVLAQIDAFTRESGVWHDVPIWKRLFGEEWQYCGRRLGLSGSSSNLNDAWASLILKRQVLAMSAMTRTRPGKIDVRVMGRSSAMVWLRESSSFCVRRRAFDRWWLAEVERWHTPAKPGEKTIAEIEGYVL